MKQLSKNWKLWEVIFLSVSVIIVSVCFFAGSDKNVLSFLTSVLGITSVFFSAKALFFAPFIDFVYNIMYAVLSIILCYYGEAIIYIVVMLPISISTIVTWLKNNSEGIVKANKITKKELLILFLCMIPIMVAFYFLLWALNTSELIIGLISVATAVVGAYFMLRRSSYYAIAFILNDIALIILWAISIADFGIMYLPTLLSVTVFLINDVYGFICWKKQEAKTEEQNTIKKVKVEK